MIKNLGILGKPVKQVPDNFGSPPPPVTVESLAQRLHELQARVVQLENKNMELELSVMQHRKALSDASHAMENSLTQGPVKWTERQREAWEQWLSEQERKSFESWQRGRKSNNVLKDVKSLPY